MAGILDLMGHIQQQGDRGRAQGEQALLGRLYSQAIGAPQAQRTGLLSQIAKVSPDAANATAGMFDQVDDNARADLGRFAMAFDALPEDQKASAYPQLAQKASALGLPVPQGGYEPRYAMGIKQLAHAFGGAMGGDSVPSDIRSLQMLRDNPELAALDRERRQAGGMVPKLIKTDSGFSWAIPGQDLAPAYERGSGGANPDSVVSTANFMRERGVPDEEIVAWINQQPGFSAPDSQGARAQPFVTPKEAPDTFVPLTPDELAAMGLPPGTFAQKSLRTGKVEIGPASVQPETPKAPKPLPVSALRLIKDETDAIDAAGTMNQILGRVKTRIEDGTLQLSLINNMVARARNATGENNESSRNYQSFISDLNKARNESLRLNKGVQTEGDAQRAWDELIANPNDPAFVLQRIAEIEEINARAIRLRQSNVDMIRRNYGADPLDFEARERGEASGGPGTLESLSNEDLMRMLNDAR